MWNIKNPKFLVVFVSSVFTVREILGNCLGPQMKLMSDDPRRTCTEIFASKDTIEYSCTSLIKGFPKAMIKYCPVEVCLKNDSWSKPSISCALSECYEEGKSKEYVGHRMCTKSGLPCQAWAAQEPHRHRFRQDEMFPDYSIHLAEAFCRDPEGSKGSPWCFTKDSREKWEFCDIKKCSEITTLDGYCGQKQQEMDTVQEETKNVDGQSGSDGELEKLDDVKKRFEKADPLHTCSGGPQFEMEKGYRIRGKVLLENKKRSVLECALQCSKMSLCRYCSFRGADGMCTLAGGEEYVVIRSIGFKAGVKSCHF